MPVVGFATHEVEAEQPVLPSGERAGLERDLGDVRHARDAGQGIEGAVAEPLLALERQLLEHHVDDGRAAEQVEVVVEVFLEVVAHGDDDDESRHAQGNGGEDADIAPTLAHDLAHADAHEVVIPHRSGTATPDAIEFRDGDLFPFSYGHNRAVGERLPGVPAPLPEAWALYKYESLERPSASSAAQTASGSSARSHSRTRNSRARRSRTDRTTSSWRSSWVLM